MLINYKLLSYSFKRRLEIKEDNVIKRAKIEKEPRSFVVSFYDCRAFFEIANTDKKEMGQMGSRAPEKLDELSKMADTLFNQVTQKQCENLTEPEKANLIRIFESLEGVLNLTDDAHPARIKEAIGGGFEGVNYLDDAYYVNELIELGKDILVRVKNEERIGLAREMFQRYFTETHACLKGELTLLQDSRHLGQNKFQRLVWGHLGNLYARLDKRLINPGNERHLLAALPILLGYPKGKLADNFAYAELRHLKLNDTKDNLVRFHEELQNCIQGYMEGMVDFFTEVGDKNVIDDAVFSEFQDANVLFQFLYESPEDLIEFCEASDKGAVAVVSDKPDKPTYYVRFEGLKDTNGVFTCHSILAALNKQALGISLQESTAESHRTQERLASLQEKMLILERLNGASPDDLLGLIREGSREFEPEDVSIEAPDSENCLKQHLAQLLDRCQDVPVIAERLNWTNESEFDAEQIQRFALGNLLDKDVVDYCAQLAKENLLAVFNTNFIRQCIVSNCPGVFTLLLNTGVISQLGKDTVLEFLQVRDGTDFNSTLFHLAGYYGHVDSLKALLEPTVIDTLGRDNVLELLQMKDSRYGRTLFHYASSMGHAGILKALLDPAVIDKLGRKNISEILQMRDEIPQAPTLFHSAAVLGHVGILEALLDPAVIGKLGKKIVGEILQMRDGSDYEHSLFHIAVVRGHANILRALLDPAVIGKLGKKIVGEILQMRDGSDFKRTLFHIAGQRGHGDTLESLLDPSVIDNLGKDTVLALLSMRDAKEQGTLFHIAACRGHVNNLKPLLDPNVIDRLGSGNVLEILQMREGIHDKYTLFYLAVDKGHGDILMLLLQPTAIHMLGKDNVLALLNIDYKDYWYTFLHYAASTGHSDSLRALLARDVE